MKKKMKSWSFSSRNPTFSRVKEEEAEGREEGGDGRQAKGGKEIIILRGFFDDLGLFFLGRFENLKRRNFLLWSNFTSRSSMAKKRRRNREERRNEEDAK